MADEIRVTTEPDLDATVTRAPHTHDAQLQANDDVIATLPAHPQQGIPARAINDPDVARTEIEHTRSRMSETIDDIEDALLRKKEQIQDRLDVFAPVKENPLPSVGISFGAGLVLGLLTGGDDEPDYEYDRYRGDDADHWEDRAETWESRARRLLRIAQEQEEELEALRDEKIGRRSRLATLSRWDEDEDDEEDDYDSEDASIVDDLRDAITGNVAGLLKNVLSQITGGTASKSG